MPLPALQVHMLLAVQQTRRQICGTKEKEGRDSVRHSARKRAISHANHPKHMLCFPVQQSKSGRQQESQLCNCLWSINFAPMPQTHITLRMQVTVSACAMCLHKHTASCRNSTAQHTAQPCALQHRTAQHSPTKHSTAQHSRTITEER